MGWVLLRALSLTRFLYWRPARFCMQHPFLLWKLRQACEHYVGLQHIILEGDFLTVLKKVWSTLSDRSAISPVIADAKDCLANFHSCWEDR
ncbi:hypothetical protein E1A91_A05G074100v1 [Gossypium mustelinum]|nr:hypothetical protein ES319_A05G072600v1 [Gossypium barbadense]TYH15884.1 hypothetical protein ES288_A05G074900v1 [Gossypium darwinii]TYJ33017.1 hypothetical protein E1A91_A05G074100v1 [Gossypium mustelinum]